MPDPLKQPKASAPPENIRLSRGGVVWQNKGAWPAPVPGAQLEELPFRVGVIFEHDEDNMVVFGVPDIDPNTKKTKKTTMGDMSGHCIVAYVPLDPTLPITEALVPHEQAQVMVAGYRAEALASWNETDEEDEPATTAAAS